MHSHMLQQTILDREIFGEIAWRGLKEINILLLLGLVEHKYSSQTFFLFQKFCTLGKALKPPQTGKLQTQGLFCRKEYENIFIACVQSYSVLELCRMSKTDLNINRMHQYGMC